jgi:hypothetical protein
MSELDSSALSLLNVSSVAQTIQIQVSAIGYTAPTTSDTNITLLSHVGGTVFIGGGANSFSYQSCVDPSNMLRSVGSQGIACFNNSFGSGLSTPAITTASAFQDTKTASIGPLSGPFSVSESYIITLAAGSQINWSASTTLAGPAPIPEPNSLALAGLGFLGFGLLLKRFRRHA